MTAQLAKDVDSLLDGDGAALVIDESAFAKQGKKSVGVARHWNGRLGMVDNSQVGVFAVLTNGAPYLFESPLFPVEFGPELVLIA